MPTLYTRTFDLKDSLSDAGVVEHWRFLMDEVVPAISKIRGTRWVKAYSGAGALRADLTLLWEMDDASVYEKAMVDPNLRKLIARVYSAWDLRMASQSFRREVTAEVLQALSGR